MWLASQRRSGVTPADASGQVAAAAAPCCRCRRAPPSATPPGALRAFFSVREISVPAALSHLVQRAVHVQLRLHGVEHAADLQLHSRIMCEPLLEAEPQRSVLTTELQAGLHPGQLQQLQCMLLVSRSAQMRAMVLLASLSVPCMRSALRSLAALRVLPPVDHASSKPWCPILRSCSALPLRLADFPSPLRLLLSPCYSASYPQL